MGTAPWSTQSPSSRPPDVRALITGASGFAGTWLVRACAQAGDEVIALSRRPAVPTAHEADGAVTSISVDLRDAEAVRATIAQADPDVVYHLAALSSVGRSWESPAQTLSENTATAINLLEALRLEARSARVVWVSTCEVYGVPDALPLTESAPLQPANPYAVSKASAEMLAAVYARAHGLDIIRARPFSHSGPGQRPIFLLASLTRQAAEGRRAGVSELTIVTGNPDTRRDFTDVRDVVRAYRLLAERAPAGVYNVSTGASVSAAEQVALLGEVVAPIVISHEVDPSRVRASEVMDLRGDHAALTATTGWKPEIPLRQTMTEAVAWWEQTLAADAGAAAPPISGGR
ncbi:MAG: GDP-mannose 4,6-dehydratase [Actinomycetota bacterium]|nr:GDP-mannose 4,6-dehydratase [Actinomycetota bacterium]